MSSKTLWIPLLACLWIASHSASGLAQSPPSNVSNTDASAAGQAQQTATSSDDGPEQRSWLVRDPTTGRLYQQELVTRTVPTTQWEVRAVPTTVYEAKQVVTTIPRQEVTYTPATQYVMQPRVKGWWNPLKQPVQAYEFVPVTTWQPQTQTVQQPVTTTQWVPKQQMVYVPQAVQRNQIQQQIVSREIPQPNGGYPPGMYAPGSLPATTLPPATMMAAQQNPMLARPLVNIPLLARQPSKSWNASGWSNSAGNTMANNGFSNSLNNGLRPITNAIAPTYSAPLQTASSATSLMARDPTQTGMSATILR